MGQPFRLRVLFRPQPRAAAAKAALPWARMDEALGLAGDATGRMGMKSAGLRPHRGTGRRGHNRAARAVHRGRLPSLEWLDPAPLATTFACRCPVSGVRCPVSGRDVRWTGMGFKCANSGAEADVEAAGKRGFCGIRRQVTWVKIHESGILGIAETAILVSIPAILGFRCPDLGGLRPETRGRTSVTLLGQNMVTRRRHSR